MDTKWSTGLWLAIDIFILFIVGLAVLIINLFGVPFHRGFYCDDETIRYPDLKSIVSNEVLGVGVLFVPIVVIAIVELSRKGRKSTGVGCTLPYGVAKWLKISAFYLLGVGLSELLIDTGKYTIGRLRPHFLAVCQPDVSCNGTSDAYISNYKCLGTDAWAILEAKKSFPSGHSAHSFYAAVFLIMYLQQVIVWNGSRLARHALQFLFLAGAWFTALSRVADNHHHWSDVLTGIAIGTLTALINVMFVLRLRRGSYLTTKLPPQDDELLI